MGELKDEARVAEATINMLMKRLVWEYRLQQDL